METHLRLSLKVTAGSEAGQPRNNQDPRRIGPKENFDTSEKLLLKQQENKRVRLVCCLGNHAGISGIPRLPAAYARLCPVEAQANLAAHYAIPQTLPPQLSNHTEFLIHNQYNNVRCGQPRRAAAAPRRAPRVPHVREGGADVDHRAECGHVSYPTRHRFPFSRCLPGSHRHHQRKCSTNHYRPVQTPPTSATGTCKNLTPQSREYVMPSRTSRRVVPAVFRERARMGVEKGAAAYVVFFSLCMSMYCVSYVGARFAYDVSCRPALLRPLPIPLRIMQAYWRALPYSAAPKATHSATFETDEEEELGELSPTATTRGDDRVQAKAEHDCSEEEPEGGAGASEDVVGEGWWVCRWPSSLLSPFLFRDALSLRASFPAPSSPPFVIIIPASIIQFPAPSSFDPRLYRASFSRPSRPVPSPPRLPPPSSPPVTRPPSHPPSTPSEVWRERAGVLGGMLRARGVALGEREEIAVDEGKE
ncbi:hypothetical protein C8J57DRAFT_1594564 [Mycena rebaudengoi]|nr:hypothetical protein C8J57DRAFT_1594564 [Mycena rebaudengoi]